MSDVDEVLDIYIMFRESGWLEPKDIAKKFDMSDELATNHCEKLREKGLIECAVVDRVEYYFIPKKRGPECHTYLVEYIENSIEQGDRANFVKLGRHIGYHPQVLYGMLDHISRGWYGRIPARFAEQIVSEMSSKL